MTEVPLAAWIVTASIALIAVAVLVYLWRSPTRRRERALRKALRQISEDTLTDLVIPDGVEGEIQIDLVTLTPRGLMVLEIKRVEGTVFGGAQVDSWTALTPRSRVAFTNPLELLNRRVVALRTLLSDKVPVSGRVVFVGDVQLGADLPPTVTTPAQLASDFSKAEQSKAPLSAYYPHWDQLRRQAAV